MLRSERVLPRVVALVSVLLFASAASAQSRQIERLLASAELAAERGRDAQALRLWRRAAALSPEDPRAALRIARTLPADAAAAVEANDAVRERAEEARRLLDAHLEVATGDTAAARRARAWASAVLGDHEGAIEAVTGLAGLQDGDSAALLRQLATLAVLAGDLPAAARALVAAHRALPQDSAILSELGAVELARGDPEAAIERFARVLGRDPSALDARRDLAGALVAAGRPDDAVELLSAAIEAHPSEVELQLELARAALEAGQPQVAERSARAALASLPDGDGRGHTTLGEALAASGRRSAARAAFEEALRRDPHDLRAQMGLDSLRR